MEQTTEDLSLRFLFGRTCKYFRVLISSKLDALGLHLGQDLILRMLWDEDGQTQSELAEKIHITGATLTRALQRMESSNLIERRSCSDDARVMRVFVTDSGNKLKPELEALWQEVEESTFAGLTADERVILRRLLMQIYSNLSEVE